MTTDTHVERVRKTRRNGRLVVAALILAAAGTTAMPVKAWIDEPDTPAEAVEQFYTAELNGDWQRVWDLMCAASHQAIGPEEEYVNGVNEMFDRRPRRTGSVIAIEGVPVEAWRVRVIIGDGSRDRPQYFVIRENGDLRVCTDPR